VVTAVTVHQRLKVRMLTRRALQPANGTPGLPVELRPGAERIAGVAVDEVYLSKGGASSAQAPFAGLQGPFAGFYAEPTRYAYPQGAVVSTVGPGGRGGLEHYLTTLATGGTAPELSRYLDPDAVFGLAVDLTPFKGLMAGLVPSGDPRQEPASKGPTSL